MGEFHLFPPSLGLSGSPRRRHHHHLSRTHPTGEESADDAADSIPALFNIFFRLHAPAPPNNPQRVPGEDEGEGTSILGLVPHQIRGYLGQFRNILVTGQQFERCTGCSEKVIQAYEAQGFPLLLRVFNEEGFLEQLTGLDKLQEESQAALDEIEGLNSDEDDF